MRRKTSPNMSSMSTPSQPTMWPNLSQAGAKSLGSQSGVDYRLRLEPRSITSHTLPGKINFNPRYISRIPSTGCGRADIHMAKFEISHPPCGQANRALGQCSFQKSACPANSGIPSNLFSLCRPREPQAGQNWTF